MTHSKLGVRGAEYTQHVHDSLQCNNFVLAQLRRQARHAAQLPQYLMARRGMLKGESCRSKVSLALLATVTTRSVAVAVFHRDQVAGGIEPIRAVRGSAHKRLCAMHERVHGPEHPTLDMETRCHYRFQQ